MNLEKYLMVKLAAGGIPINPAMLHEMGHAQMNMNPMNAVSYQQILAQRQAQRRAAMLAKRRAALGPNTGPIYDPMKSAYPAGAVQPINLTPSPLTMHEMGHNPIN